MLPLMMLKCPLSVILIKAARHECLEQNKDWLSIIKLLLIKCLSVILFMCLSNLFESEDNRKIGL